MPAYLIVIGICVLIGASALWIAGWRRERRRQALIHDLCRNQELLTTFVRRIPAAVAMLDRDLRYLEVSDRWCADYKLTRDGLMGRSHYEVFPEIPERWKELHRRGLAGETLRAEEDLFERTDGTQAWLHWEISPWGRRDGLPEGILIFSEDVTSQRQIEQSLIETQQAARALADNSPDGVVRFDCQGRYRFANKRVLEATGLREQDLIGKTPVEAGLPLSFAQPWLESILRVVASGYPEISILAYPTPDGSRLWEMRTIPELDEHGAVQSIIGLRLDITERRQAEELAHQNELEIHERESIIATLVDTASQAIFAVGEDGTIQLANRITEEIFGYEPGQLIGQSHEELVPEAMRERHVKLRESFMAEPKRRPMGAGLDLEARRKDGSRFPVEVSLSHLKTSRGPLAVCFVTDITVRRQNELALRETERDLRRLSAALMSAEEDTARQIARELHDDINQRLAALSMQIGETAASSPEPVELNRRLRSFQAKIVEISWAIRKISHQMHPSILDDLGLPAAIESLCVEMRQAEGIPVGFKAYDVPAEIDRAIAYCLYRVAQESLQNIAKHAQADDAFVSVSRENGWLQLSIIDSGVGFDDGTRKNGLGTHSMRERVRLVNGEISIESVPRQGTRVIARVPLPGKQTAQCAP